MRLYHKLLQWVNHPFRSFFSLAKSDSASVPVGMVRSSGWAHLRNKFVASHPYCALCGCTTDLTAHHIIPVHIDPSKELEWDNLIVLCESKGKGVNCHLFFGHLGNWKKWNPTCIEDVEKWKSKISIVSPPIINK